MRIARWIIKTTDTFSEYAIRIAFSRKNGYANAPQYCIIYKLPVLFSSTVSQPRSFSVVEYRGGYE